MSFERPNRVLEDMQCINNIRGLFIEVYMFYIYIYDDILLSLMYLCLIFIIIRERLIKFETFLHGCLVRRVAFIYAYF